MQTLEAMLSGVTLGGTILYFSFGFLVWFLAYGLEMYRNSGSLGRGRFWVFECFWEDLLWFLPGGLARRTEHIRNIVGPESQSRGSIGDYSFEHIRTHNLYEEVAKKSLGSGYYFWGVNVLLMFFLWPVVFTLFVGLILVNNLVRMMRELFLGSQKKRE